MGLVRQWLDLTGSSPFPLIVTTCIDGGLEEEFKNVKTLDKVNPIPFDLVWYVAAETGRDRPGGYKYKRHATEDVIKIKRGQIARKGRTAPITILKLFGNSSDRFLITEDQMSYSLSDLADPIPQDLLCLLDNRKMLYIGFSPNDADVSAVVRRLYPPQTDTGTISSSPKIPTVSWLIHRSITGRLDEAIWRSYGTTPELARLVQLDISLDEVMAYLCETALDLRKAQLQRSLV